MLPSRPAITRHVSLSVSAERVAYFVKSFRTSVCPDAVVVDGVEISVVLQIQSLDVRERHIERARQLFREVVAQARHQVRALGFGHQRRVLIGTPSVTADIGCKRARPAVLTDLERHDAGAVGRRLQPRVVDDAVVARLVHAPIGREEGLRHSGNCRNIRCPGRLKGAAVRKELPAFGAPFLFVRTTENRILLRKLAADDDVTATAE
jgi:hypothetical protein